VSNPSVPTRPPERPKLCYLNRSLELSDGEYFMGRDPSCHLVVDDPLSSRRHARLLVRGDIVTIEDLGSRNGVIVNGTRISNVLRLADGDRITVGSQELIFRQGARPVPVAVGRVTLSRMVRVPQPNTPPSPAEDPARFAASTIGRSDVQNEARLEAFRVLAGLAEKALTDGQPDVAEHVLERALAEVISTTRCGLRVQPELAHFAARYGVKLGRATKKAFWVDYVVDLYCLLGVLLPRDVVDELIQVVPIVGPMDKLTMRSYLSKARAYAARQGMSEVGLLQRTEELGRLVERLPQ
jgi:hypothetical protein